MVGRKGKRTPLTAAEKMKRYRAKKSEEDPIVLAEKNRDNVRMCRERMSDEAKEEIKRKDKIRKKEERLRKKIIQNEGKEPIYKTAAALGKARNKTMKALPKDPERALEVVNGIKKMLDKKLATQVEEVVQEESPKSKIRVADRNRIVSFYYRKDVSYTFPGKKDYVIVKRTEGKRVKMTKHVLMITLREAHSEFCSQEPDIKVGLDTFSRLRPANVLLRHKMPKNVCVCQYHININYLISALHQHEDDFPSNHRDLLKVTTCALENMEKEECQMGRCQDCLKLWTMEQMLELLGTSVEICKAWFVKYFRWEDLTDGMGKMRMCKVEKYESLFNILQQLVTDLPAFKIHRMVKVKQDLAFNHLQECLSHGDLLVQFDFSENAEIQEQDEIQSAHWYHLTCTVFTAVAWINGMTISFGVISDYLNHDKYFSVVALFQILKKLQEKFGTIPRINLFSDGAAQHFKQRFFLNGVTLIPEFLGMSRDEVDITYNLFATSHGKGAVDGVGGSIKRSVMSTVVSRKVLIHNSKDFANTAKEVCKKIQIFHISKEEVEHESKLLDLVAFTDVKQLVGVRKVHSIKVKGPYKVEVSSYKGSSDSRLHSFK